MIAVPIVRHGIVARCTNVAICWRDFFVWHFKPCQEWGTAVNVQAMVFGNMGNDCATGVAFTRNPSNGAKASPVVSPLCESLFTHLQESQ